MLRRMTIRENEALASLKILAAIARADGSVHNDERKSLAAALDNLELPAPVKIEELLADTSIDVASELAKLESPEAREQIYRSAFFMAHADGTCTKEEQAILDLVATETQVTPAARQSLDRIFAPARTSLLPTKLSKVEDAGERTKKVQSQVMKYAIVSAVLGAFPVPGVAIATDLAVIALQLKMVRDIGKLWGHDVDRNAAKSMLYTMGLGTGARLAVNNLAKLLPGWGSAIGATTSFASTFALGRVIEKFFSADAKVDLASLKPDFDAAQKEGKAAYKEQKAEIAKQEIESKRTLDLLGEDVKKGLISQDELERRVAEMSESRE